MGFLEVDIVATGVPNDCLELLVEKRFVGTTGTCQSKYYMAIWQDFELKKICSITGKRKQARKRGRGFEGPKKDFKEFNNAQMEGAPRSYQVLASPPGRIFQQFAPANLGVHYFPICDPLWSCIYWERRSCRSQTIPGVL